MLYFSLEMPNNEIEKLLFLTEDIEEGYYVRKKYGHDCFCSVPYTRGGSYIYGSLQYIHIHSPFFTRVHCRWMANRDFESFEFRYFSPDAWSGCTERELCLCPVFSCILLDQTIIIHLKQYIVYHTA